MQDDREGPPNATTNLRTKILDFRGFDPLSNLILRGGFVMPIGNFTVSLSQQILVGIILVGRLGGIPNCATRITKSCKADVEQAQHRGRSC